ncbi:hypothetical protein SELMODRAFT_431554 [Selaginella moellendorffii]|uniref:Uncharacterized protein n=1 Tax=Selaginella moellendorffii TaxID=88036 RepID=D8TD15_SELML|nr:hypothetical protein SELMODRAFT_431554 [Selaginella moellendorffii]
MSSKLRLTLRPAGDEFWTSEQISAVVMSVVEISLHTFRSKPIGLSNVCRHFAAPERSSLSGLLSPHMQVFPSKLARQGTFGTFEWFPIEISSLDLGKHVNPPSCHIERQAICCLGHGNSSTYNFQTQSRSKLSETFCQVCLLPVELWKWIKFLYSSSYCVPLIELNLPLVPVVHFDSLEGESMQELEDYAVQKAEETTAATYKALNLMKRSLPSFMSIIRSLTLTILL